MNELWQRDEVDSPCVNICVFDERAGICIGCKRTKSEIATWSNMTPQQRDTIKKALPARGTMLQSKRRGGRKGRHKNS